ncbi:MAG: hypothetical protein HQL16_05415 [Candidatus Omnitrophica bacterium]|nr:hypothetical protein [Candidatus Omnitrophota bacterium]
MKRVMLLVVLLLAASGCASLPWTSAVDLSDGVNRSEALKLARKQITNTQYADDVDVKSGRVVVNKNTACLVNYWLVTFRDNNPFWQQRYYYVLVHKTDGHVLRNGINWVKGDQWTPMLHGVDQCQ